MYMGERAQKLVLPFGLGYILLCPVTAYIQALYEGFQGGFISFLPRFFWYDTYHYLGYGHLWFLLYLFVFSIICVPLFKWWQAEGGHLERIGAFFSKGNRLLLPIAFIVLLNFGRLCLNRKGRALTYLNRASFTIYIFHYLPVNFFTWLFIRLQMPIFVKYLLLVSLSCLAVFCIWELWQRVKK